MLDEWDGWTVVVVAVLVATGSWPWRSVDDETAHVQALREASILVACFPRHALVKVDAVVDNIVLCGSRLACIWDVVVVVGAWYFGLGLVADQASDFARPEYAVLKLVTNVNHE